MKNYIKRLFIALLFLCLVVTLPAQKHVNNPDEIFLDTSGNYALHYKPQNIQNKSGKIEKDLIDVVVDVAIEGWDAIFEKDRPKVIYNAFDIGVDTIFEKEKSISPTLLTMKNRVIPKVVEAPMPVFEKQEMTVKFEDGKFVPIAAKKDSVERLGKGIVESTFKMDVVDFEEIELDFFKSNSFVYNNEVYHRVSMEELETEEYKKPRIKTASRPKGELAATTPSVKEVKITSNEQFVDLYEDAALDGERYGVPYSITMAQGILESRGGRSRLAIALNNLFGIKCNGGRCQKEGCKHGYFTDDRKDETFERHASYEASFKRHIKFFLDNERYNKCLSCGANDIECWLYRLQKSGYATDKMYDYKLAEIINRYKLTTKPIRYDRKKVVERLKANQS
jgi:flagellum-specific peptidoglycan hydrolase FlgJ